MGSERRLLLAALAASMLIATPARAQTAVDREMARSLMDQGYDLKHKGDLKQAMKRFKAADDIMHVPTTALPLAQVQTDLGLLVEARDTLARLRRTPEQPNDPQPFKAARADGEKLDASLAPRVPSLTITLANLPAGDTPTLDVDGIDVPADAVGLPRPLDPGHHVVTVKSPHAQGRQEVDVKEGEQKSVQVALSAVAVPESTPQPQPDQAQPAQSEAPPDSVKSHGPTVLTWIGIGLAGAGVATGAATGLMSMNKKSALESECPNGICGPAQHSDYQAANTFALVSTIGFAAAGVGAALAVVTLLVGHEEPAPPPASTPPESGLLVRPWIGVGSAGLAGSF